MKKVKSFRKQILIVFMVGYFLIILTLFSYSAYLSYHYSQGVRQSGNAMMNLYINELDYLLDNSRKYLREVVLHNNSSLVLQSPADEVIKYGAAYDLINMLNSQLIFNKELAGFIVQYNDDQCYYTFQDDISFETKQQIKNSVNQEIEEGMAGKDWVVIRGPKKAFLALTCMAGNTNVTVIIDFETVTSEIVDKYNASTAEIIFLDSQGVLGYSQLDSQIELEQLDDQTTEWNVWFQNQKFFVFSGDIEHTDLKMYVILPNESGLTQENSQRYIVGILFLAMVCVGYTYHYLQRKFIAPLQMMMVIMEKISAGQIDEEMPTDIDIAEYQQTATIFNSMMKQVKELKIMAYEEAIKEQKARLQYLQLQIKPHFFLNCLKTLYALHQQGKGEKVEDIIIDTSKYFRYTFRDTFTLVSVREELEFTTEYLNIQKNNTGIDVKCEVVVDSERLNAELLPLTIQTFVENSVKYALPSEKLRIRINISFLEGIEEDYLDIVVSDNGQGYEAEWLRLLNEKDYHVEDGQHVGLLNLKQRLNLYYGDSAEFAVRNHHGAISEVIIPQKREISDKDGIKG